MLLATFSLASAQTIDIKGTVIDENGEPVIGASVMIKGTLKGDITDVSGRFSLGGVKTTDKLAVSCIGMIPVEIDPQAEMRITLKTDHEQLDEVLVVAFGQQTKSSFTGSAAVVKSETLEKKQLTNVMSGLQGQVAGLQMINNSGSPTATPSMAIRGFSSINAGTSPLIIVAGSPYDGGWNNLNPNDVENITVLKDAPPTHFTVREEPTDGSSFTRRQAEVTTTRNSTATRAKADPSGSTATRPRAIRSSPGPVTAAV